jgi:type VI secretion system protein ImpF
VTVQKLNPTLFDKLASGGVSGLRASRLEETAEEINRFSLRNYELANIDRYTESALRFNVRRELAWIMNTTSLESAQDISTAPHVRTSVVNYGVADLTGKSHSRREIDARARKIRDSIIAFEPRLEPASLQVEARAAAERENAVTFVITGDITSAVQALKVQYLTDIEVDTGAATVRD